jgi:hypothetical protein
MNAFDEQPDPTPNELPAVWDLVLEDMRKRDELGRQRYGTRLQPHNGRDSLRDLYEELLDAVAYTRQLIAERDEHAAVRSIDGKIIMYLPVQKEQS